MGLARSRHALPRLGGCVKKCVSVRFRRAAVPISIHAPRVGSDLVPIKSSVPRDVISIPAPRVGSDAPAPSRRNAPRYFNPRSPCGERRFDQLTGDNASKFQSTLPVWGATGSGHLDQALWRISIHAPRVGSDAAKPSALVPVILFQSTLPVWGATGLLSVYLRRPSYFNPRSPCGERLFGAAAASCMVAFQSTLPVWGATRARARARRRTSYFNPRSPCGERRDATRGQSKYLDFNPRSPCGERLSVMSSSESAYTFQSTLPVWGATLAGLDWCAVILFQSTLPVWGATIHAFASLACFLIFQSTLPVWGATGGRPHRGVCRRDFNQHPLQPSWWRQRSKAPRMPAASGSLLESTFYEQGA